MSNLSIVSIIVTLFVSFILPLAFLVGYALRHKKQGIWSAWLLGALGFFVLPNFLYSGLLCLFTQPEKIGIMSTK